MRKRKAISVTLLLSILTVSLSGCGKSSDNPIDSMSKSELREAYYNLESGYQQLQGQFDSLNTMYQALSTEEQPIAPISMSGDGTGRYTFTSVDSKIIFPAAFQYPGTQAIQADGSINVVDNVEITPGSNWITKLNGATLEMEHSSGISATIKVGGVTESYDKSLLQSEVLEQWFVNIPESQVAYKNIFIDGTMFGVQATTPTMIDSEVAFLRCGMLAYGDYSVTYIFVYRGEQDVTKDESIVNVINTIKVMNNGINVEA